MENKEHFNSPPVISTNGRNLYSAIRFLPLVEMTDSNLLT